MKGYNINFRVSLYLFVYFTPLPATLTTRRIMAGLVDWKAYGKKRVWLTLSIFPLSRPEKLGENPQILSQACCSVPTRSYSACTCWVFTCHVTFTVATGHFGHLLLYSD